MLGGVAIVAQRSVAQNLLANPSFEDPITSDGAPFVGSWEGFAGGAGASATNSSVNPRTGAQHAAIDIQNVNNSFAGVFQDVPGLVAGQPGVFSGFYRTTTDPLGPVSEFRIEWRNSVSNTEISRTPNQTIPPTGAYTEFTLAAPVPVGADTARVVYALQTFGGTSDTGTVFLDDLSFTIPEPASLAGLAVGGLIVSSRRRRAS
jgi:hypothetical protein